MTVGEDNLVASGATVGTPPGVTDESRKYWEGALRDEFIVERCRGCGAHIFPIRGVCRICRGRDMEETRLEGPGTIYTFTVNEHRWFPEQQVPYVLALIDFPEGVRILARVRGCDPYEVAEGMTVDIAFEPGPGGWNIPSFVVRSSS